MKKNIKLPNLNKVKIFRNKLYWFIVPITIIFVALICGTVILIRKRKKAKKNGKKKKKISKGQ